MGDHKAAAGRQAFPNLSRKGLFVCKMGISAVKKGGVKAGLRKIKNIGCDQFHAGKRVFLPGNGNHLI